ncbi:hypothetical protein FB107DRAFT_221236 [Schizophyllum commune]
MHSRERVAAKKSRGRAEGAKNVIAILLDLDNSKLEFLSRTTLKENRRVMLGKDCYFVYIDGREILHKRQAVR